MTIPDGKQSVRQGHTHSPASIWLLCHGRREGGTRPCSMHRIYATPEKSVRMFAGKGGGGRRCKILMVAAASSVLLCTLFSPCTTHVTCVCITVCYTLPPSPIQGRLAHNQPGSSLIKKHALQTHATSLPLSLHVYSRSLQGAVRSCTPHTHTLHTLITAGGSLEDW